MPPVAPSERQGSEVAGVSASGVDGVDAGALGRQSLDGAAHQCQLAALLLDRGAHLLARPDDVEGKGAAAYAAGVRRMDGALRGYGGCPMANDTLTGNLPTERVAALVLLFFFLGRSALLGCFFLSRPAFPVLSALPFFR